MPYPFPKETRAPSFSSKEAGEKGVLHLPVGLYTYNSLTLPLTSGRGVLTSVADVIEYLDIKASGKSFRLYDGDKIDYLQNFAGDGLSSYQDGNDPVLFINFSELSARNATGEDIASLGTADLSSLEIEVKFKAGITDLDCNGFMEFMELALPSGTVRQVRSQRVNVNGAGKHTHMTLPVDMPYYRIHLFSDKVLSVLLRFNGDIPFELSKVVNTANQTRAGLTPISTVYTIAFDKRLRYEEFLDVVGSSEFHLELDMDAGAQPFDIVFEQIGKVTTKDRS